MDDLNNRFFYMKNYLVIISILFLFSCSEEEETPQQKEFIKFCYYASNTNISKSECSCIYKDLIKSSYTKQEMQRILKDDYPQEVLLDVKNRFSKNLMKSYKGCK